MDLDEAIEIVLVIRSKRREIRRAPAGAEVTLPEIRGLELFGRECVLKEAVLEIVG